ncbi:MAG TPA: hypothetical protein VFA94_06995 [Acidimicrobiales bacterium]|nr:hypothetical protein [Acidimicrobiales bacterium]
MRRACLLVMCATVVATALTFLHGSPTTTVDPHGSDAVSALAKDSGATPSMLAVTVAVVVLAALSGRQRVPQRAPGVVRTGRTASTCERAPPGAGRTQVVAITA